MFPVNMSPHGSLAFGAQSVSQSAFIQVGEIRWFVTGGFCIRISLSQTNEICRRASRNVMGKDPPPPPPKKKKTKKKNKLLFKKEFQGYYKLILLSRTNAAICLVWALAQNSTFQKMCTTGV